MSPSSPKAKLAEYRKKRDFSRTAEPSGDAPVKSASRLRFVIQKHAASHLHFDFRLELDGVMKSWAVPKGPSLNPGVRRLAMEVEDHPISYNTFEGTIPAGEYGGGTVMLWDRGTYDATDGGGARSLRAGYESGTLDITMHGSRIAGRFTLVRTRSTEGSKPQWLLIKRTDAHASADADVTAEVTTSVATGRTMEEIAAGKGGARIWNSNRGSGSGASAGEPKALTTRKASAKKSVAKKSMAKKSSPKKSVAKSGAAKRTAAGSRSAAKAATKKTPARKAAAKKAAKKSGAKRAPSAARGSAKKPATRGRSRSTDDDGPAPGGAPPPGRYASSARTPSPAKRTGNRGTATRASATRMSASRAASAQRPARLTSASTESVVRQLASIEANGGDGVLALAGGVELPVTKLDKVFFPADGYTKGDLMRYYAQVWPAIEPVMRDRPLVLKRFPNGITGKSFFQQSAPDDTPDVARVETLTNDKGELQHRFVGDGLSTLLYTIQIGAVSVDPWHARIDSLRTPDYTVLDLDPMPKASFARVVQVAQWTLEELDAMGLHAAIKTSGSSGLHLHLPLPDETPEEAALLIAQIVATRVAAAHPRQATVERSVGARAADAVYIDYLQNLSSKTVAAAYCVRAKPGATVSTPLERAELDDPSLDLHDFTIETVPARLAEKGDLWANGMKKPNRIERLATSG